MELPPGDVDPASGRARLSYRQAEDLFKAATGGATLHQLRHSALTHDAEDGVNTHQCSKPGPGTPQCAHSRATRGYPPKRSPATRPSATQRGAGDSPGRP